MCINVHWKPSCRRDDAPHPSSPHGASRVLNTILIIKQAANAPEEPTASGSSTSCNQFQLTDR